jgi:hypothetical protein
MNYDVTLISKATQSIERPLPPDVRAVGEHLGVSTSRSIELRQSVSAWLYRLAERVAPRPVRAEYDELFEAISTMLAEPACQVSPVNMASHQRC